MTAVVDKLLELIDVERAYAIEETQRILDTYDAKQAAAKGVSLLNLRVTNQRTGLGGKSMVDFEPQFAGSILPAHKMRYGDIVEVLGAHKGKKDKKSVLAESWRGVVHRVGDQAISIVMEPDLPDNFGNDSYRINKLVDDVNFERMRKGLEILKEMLASDKYNALLRVAFGKGEPSTPISCGEIKFLNEGLNEPQQDAIRFALESQEIALIHGPPGTGKTTTVVEILQQLLLRGKRVLVCTPSNVAVDNIIERIPRNKANPPMIRLGHPSRILPSALDYALDVQLKQCDSGQIVADIRTEIDDHLKKVSKAKSYADRKALFTEIKALRKDLRQREPKVLQDLITKARVIFSTLSGAGSKMIRDETFDVVMIDEVSQSLEPECWIALMKAPKAILAGDPMQLPPTVLSTQASRRGLERTLYDRLSKMHGDKIQRLLSIQYRMHETIMNWSSREMYNGKLDAFPSVRLRQLYDLPHVVRNEDTEPTLILFDTSGCECTESADEDDSKLNTYEAKLAAMHVEALIHSNVPADSIALITPYNAQVQHLKSLLKEKYPALEIGSVDGFQGREKEVVVLSLVRSNAQGQVGFLAESRRLNVAITRAKRQVCLICDVETVGRDEFMKRMVAYFEEHADHRYAYMYEDVLHGSG